MCCDLRGRGGAIWKTKDLRCISDLSPLAQTHLLIVPRSHIPTFLCSEGIHVRAAAVDIVKMLINKTESNWIVAEHGSSLTTPDSRDLSHAHIHLIECGDPLLTPRLVTSTLEGYCSLQANWIPLKDTHAIRTSVEYFWTLDFLNEGSYLILNANSSGKQYFRRTMSDLLGKPFQRYELARSIREARRITRTWRQKCEELQWP
jgi:hypothetical protein